MTEIRKKFLFRLALNVGVHRPTSLGSRRVAPIAGGTFEGPLLSGTVLPGGTEWMIEDAARSRLRIDVRVPLRTHDGDLLAMAYQGFSHGPPDVLAKVLRGETVDADSYHYTVGGTFETASPKLAHLNMLVFLATSWRNSVRQAYDVFEAVGVRRKERGYD